MSTYLKFLQRNKLYTAFNVLGLTIAMTFVILLAVFAGKQMSIDHFQKNADRIYAVADNEGLYSPYYLQKYLKDRYPEIENTCAFSVEHYDFKIGTNTISAKTDLADTSFFSMFSFDVLDGDIQTWKNSLETCVISRKVADTYFQEESPIGKEIQWMDLEKPLVIAAVCENFEDSCLPYADILLRADWLPRINSGNDMEMRNAGAGVTFLMMHEGMNIEDKMDDLQSYLKEILWLYQIYDYQVSLLPLKDVFFSQLDKMEFLERGDKHVVNLFFISCIVLLLLAVLNYVNMTTAISGFRAKEMATRRLVGASGGSVFRKMILESVFLCLVSVIIAAVLAQLLSPVASKLLSCDFSVKEAISPLNCVIAFIFIAIVGIIAGIAPAGLVVKENPVNIVKGSFRRKVKTLYSKLIIILQNIISCVMTIIMLVMILQVRHMINAPLGYNTEDILVVQNNCDHKVFKQELLELPCVEAVGVGDGTPLLGTNNNSLPMRDGKWMSFQKIQGDHAYFEIFGLRKKQDNHIANRWWVNEYTFKQLDAPESITELNCEHGDIPIGGIYYDFKVMTLLEEQHPALIFDHGETFPEGREPWTIVIKTRGAHGEAYTAIAELYAKLFPDRIFDAEYLTTSIRNVFTPQIQALKIVSIFTVLAIFVSLLGLFAMSIYYMQQERKSVALKKVMGGERVAIFCDCVRTFVAMSLMAVIVSIPICWFIMKSWLSTFSYRIGLHWWIFAIAGAFTVLMSFVTVVIQVSKALNVNPVEAIKLE